MNSFTPTIVFYSLLAMLVVVFCFSAVALWSSGYTWHDQQRISQLLLLCACASLAVLLPQANLSRSALLLLAGLFLLGLFSSVLADYPLWALKEWSRYGGLVLLALIVGGLKGRPALQNAILWIMAIVGFIHAFQFLVAYAAAFISGMRMLNADMLFSGFSNPRFFGQFQVMLMPVIALLAERCRQRQRFSLAALLVLVLVTQWCIAFALGGRGLWSMSST